MNLAQLQQQLTETPDIFNAIFNREVLLPILLGEDTEDLTYWLGKEVARRFPLKDFEDVRRFFNLVGWGDLSLSGHQKGTTTLSLAGEPIEARISLGKNGGFNLETGFLSETYQQQNGFLTEGTYQAETQRVQVTLRSDLKDPLTNLPPDFIQFKPASDDQSK